MIKSTLLPNGLVDLTATAGLIHKIGTDVYVHSISVSPDSLNMYEEVSEEPAYSQTQYDAKVTELIREKYSLDAELALVNNFNAGTHLEEYHEFQEYRIACKQRAKDPELYKENGYE